MAEVYAPIAKDESFNTNESPSRNIADVLAEELSNIAQSIGAINQKYKIVQTLPDTDISTTAIYLVPKSTAQTDNTYDEYINLTGTSLGWEKIGDTEIDLSDYYTESEVDALLTEKADVSDIPVLPTADEQTSTTGEFETVTGGLLSECEIELEPVQDLHGYDHPWVGGAGKNKLQNTATSQTIGGVTLTVNSDGTVTANGTATAYVSLTLYEKNVSCPYNGYILSGCPSGGGGSTYEIRVSDVATTSSADYGEGRAIDLTNTGRWRALLIIRSGTTVNNLVFKPMIRLATSSSEFEPYSNICPISGYTQADVTVKGKNFYNALSEVGNWTKQRCTATFNGDGSITATNTQSGATWFGYVATLGNTVNINSCPCSKGDSFIITSGNNTVCSLVTVGEVDSNNILLKATDVTSGATFIVTEDDTTAIVLRYALNLSNGATGTIYPMIRLATVTDSTFEAYKGKTYTIPFNQTVYGGTLDVLSGELTIDKTKKTYNGTENFAMATGTNYHQFYISFPVNITKTNIICDSFTTIEFSERGQKTGIAVLNDPTIRFCFKDDELLISTLEDFSTWLSAHNVDVVYPLATPTTISLTPQQIVSLVGKNYVDAPLDGQSIVEVKFKQLMTIDDVIALIGG